MAFWWSATWETGYTLPYKSDLIFAFRLKYRNIFVVPELRSKTRETRYRLPDVCVLLVRPQTRFLVEAAFVAIEILSEKDSMSLMLEKLEEYAQVGVPNIWLIDPRLQTLFVYSSGTLHEIRGEIIATSEPRLELTRQEIFQETHEPNPSLRASRRPCASKA